MKSDFQYQLALHITILVWGFTGILGDLIAIEALPLVWYRMLIAFITLGIYLRIRGFSFALPSKDIKVLLGTGVIIAAHWYTFFHAIKISNVSVALTCLSTGSLFASIMEPLVFKRPIRWYEIGLGSVVIAGLYLIFYFEGSQYLAGMLTAMCSAFLATCFSMINGKYIHKIKPGQISFYEMLGGFLALSLYLGVSGDLWTEQFFQISTSDWLYLILLGTICTAIAFVVGVRVMKKLSPFTVILSINLEPIYGIILALMINGEKEHMSPQFYVGALIILSAIFANGYIKKKWAHRLKA